MKMIHTFKHSIRVHIAPEELRKAEKALNLHYLGTENCNRLDENGEFVAIDHENYPLLEKAHHNVKMTYEMELQLNVYEDGSIVCAPLSLEAEKE